jgi:thiol-disulfide isomerase/thioredoxin
MKRLLSFVLYTALAVGANAGPVDTEALEVLREGTMKKLVFAGEPAPVSDAPFTDPQGGEHRLSDWKGKYVLVNFWATWCAPCRKEMPALNAIQTDFGGDAFEVVTIATGRNTLQGINRFFDEAGVTELPILLDPKQGLAREMAVLGLPVTVLLDPEGREIARMRGDAEWDGESARAIIAALVSGS